MLLVQPFSSTFGKTSTANNDHDQYTLMRSRYGITYIGSALFVRKLRMLISPARGPSAVSNKVVGVHFPSASSLKVKYFQACVPPKLQVAHSLSVVQVSLENDQT
jgi:hypothetical protein